MGEGAQGVQRLVALDLPAAGVVVAADAPDQVARTDDQSDALGPMELEEREAGGVGAQFDPGGGVRMTA